MESASCLLFASPHIYFLFLKVAQVLALAAHKLNGNYSEKTGVAHARIMRKFMKCLKNKTKTHEVKTKKQGREGQWAHNPPPYI